MNVYSAILRRRSIRRFKQQHIQENLLFKLVDTSRLAPSAGNNQPLAFITISTGEGCEKIFPHLEWARYIENDEPPEGKRPAAYIVVLIDREVLPEGGAHDVGAAVQNMLLAALEEGLGSCWIRSFDREKIAELLNVPESMELDSVIALGKPAESPITEIMRESGKYWRDERGLMHVPKRLLDNILHKEKF
ncbi:MAG TPA: nitroreductase family protein [bacterium]|nr:nitroreductase family protein [bacterium]